MKYIVLLRGVNVGGKTIVKMAELREKLAADGFGGVKTYIQSGNVIVESGDDAATVESRIEALLEREFFRTPVMVRSAAEVRAITDANPFRNQDFELKLFHVAFFKEPPTPDQKAAIEALSDAAESYAVRGRELYCLLREGVADSKIGKRAVEKIVKTPATARNLRTINTLLEMANA